MRIVVGKFKKKKIETSIGWIIFKRNRNVYFYVLMKYFMKYFYLSLHFRFLICIFDFAILIDLFCSFYFTFNTKTKYIKFHFHFLFGFFMRSMFYLYKLCSLFYVLGNYISIYQLKITFPLM